MKSMHFPRPYKRKKRAPLIIAIAIGLLLVVVGIQPAFLTRMMLFVSAPFHDARIDASANVESFWGGFSSRQSLVKENSTLREELTRAKIKADLYDALRKEYSGRTENSASSTEGVVGFVLATPPFSPYDTLLIDKGTAHGVSVGDTVSFDATVALGTVESISKNASRVRLFSSPGYEQEVRIGESDFVVLARGQGGGTFEVSVPKEIAIERNDHIFLFSGELLGVVKKVVESDAEAFLTVTATTPENIFEVRTVIVHPQNVLE